jgi:hypothetical protein
VLILFIMSVVCFLALIGAAVAMVRHVRSRRQSEWVAAPPQPGFDRHLYAAVKYGSARRMRQIPQQRVESITAKKAWNAPSEAVEIHPAMEEQPDAGRKKSPQRASRGSAHYSSNRMDWTHFNKDYGDLTDPHPSRSVQAASDRASSRKRY